MNVNTILNNINTLNFKSNQGFYYNIRFLKEEQRHSMLSNFYTYAIIIFAYFKIFFKYFLIYFNMSFLIFKSINIFRS